MRCCLWGVDLWGVDLGVDSGGVDLKYRKLFGYLRKTEIGTKTNGRCSALSWNGFVYVHSLHDFHNVSGASYTYTSAILKYLYIYMLCYNIF